MEIAGASDPGRVRTNNEDSYGYDAALGVLVLCDGMGGEAAGEVASDLAVNSVLAYFRQGETGREAPEQERVEEVSDEANQLGGAFLAANRTIREAIWKNPELKGMGTTVVAALLRGRSLAVAHLGDSRIYLIREQQIEQLTNDHSFVMEQVRRGMMTIEEAQHSPIQNIITRALGAAESVEPDLADRELQSEDVMLMCSDGLTRHLDDEQILKVVSSAANMQEACIRLIAEANAAGGVDNITCLLMRVL